MAYTDKSNKVQKLKQLFDSTDVTSSTSLDRQPKPAVKLNVREGGALRPPSITFNKLAKEAKEKVGSRSSKLVYDDDNGKASFKKPQVAVKPVIGKSDNSSKVQTKPKLKQPLLPPKPRQNFSSPELLQSGPTTKQLALDQATRDISSNYVKRNSAAMPPLKPPRVAPQAAQTGDYIARKSALCAQVSSKALLPPSGASHAEGPANSAPCEAIAIEKNTLYHYGDSCVRGNSYHYGDSAVLANSSNRDVDFEHYDETTFAEKGCSSLEEDHYYDYPYPPMPSNPPVPSNLIVKPAEVEKSGSHSRFFIPMEASDKKEVLPVHPPVSRKALSIAPPTPSGLPADVQVVQNRGYHRLPRCRSVDMLNSWSSGSFTSDHSTEYMYVHSTLGRRDGQSDEEVATEYDVPWNKDALVQKLFTPPQSPLRHGAGAYHVASVLTSGASPSPWTYEDARFFPQTTGGATVLQNQRGNKGVMVRNRVNKCFAAYEPVNAEQSSTAQKDWDDDGVVDKEEIRRHVNYMALKRQYTKQKRHKSVYYALATALHPHVFDSFLHVTLKVKESSSRHEEYEPELLRELPRNRFSVDSTVLQFCIPEASYYDLSVSEDQTKTYCFVLTDETGKRRLGYCRKIHLVGCQFPEVLCFISEARSATFYDQLLVKAERCRRISTADLYSLASVLYARPLPVASGRLQFPHSCSNESDLFISVQRPREVYQDMHGTAALLAALGPDLMLILFASALLERRIVLTSCCPQVLSACVLGLAALLYPLDWQHTLVPVLPPSLLEVCCTPTPFLVGLCKSQLAALQNMPTEEMLVVDLEERCLLQHQNDEKNILPRKLHKSLLSALKMAEDSKNDKAEREMILREAFLRFFVEIFMDFERYCTPQAFQFDEFIQERRSSSVRDFLSWFVQSQMVDVFVATRANGGTPPNEPFFTRLREREMEQRSWPLLKENLRQFARRMKNIFVKGKGIRV